MWASKTVSEPLYQTPSPSPKDPGEVNRGEKHPSNQNPKKFQRDCLWTKSSWLKITEHERNYNPELAEQWTTTLGSSSTGMTAVCDDIDSWGASIAHGFGFYHLGPL